MAIRQLLRVHPIKSHANPSQIPLSHHFPMVYAASILSLFPTRSVNRHGLPQERSPEPREARCWLCSTRKGTPGRALGCS